jgi:GT2 family glycosyltransferase/glycosyltransferase involved in cell wall biosynthesis
MRVLFVVHGFPPEATGGTEIYASGLAQALSRRGHGLVVLARDAHSDEPEYRVRRARAGDIPVAFVNHTFRDAESFEHTYRDAAIDAIAGSLLDKERPDVVHVHHFTCLSTGIAAECAARDIPFVLTLNDYWLLCHRGQLLDLELSRCPGPEPDRCAACAGLSASGDRVVHLAARGLRAIERHTPKALGDVRRRLVAAMSTGIVPATAAAEAARRLEHTRGVCEGAARILAPSRTMFERFAQAGIARSRMILQQQGIASQPGPRLSPRASDRLHLGFIGSLMASKAPHVLLEAAAGLPADRVKVTIAGDVTPYHGDHRYADTLRPLLDRPGVEWFGRVEHDRVPSVLAGLDVLVVPSIWIENAPFVIKEAFAAGVPVVASNLGGMAELVQDGRSGLLFTAGDPADLRRVLRRLLDEPALLPALREGLPRVKTMDEDAAWTEEVYREVLAERSARRMVAARPSIAAVILNYNTPDDTLLALRSLQASRRSPDQVIVVDNGPDESCAEALAPLMSGIRFIRSPRNVGLSAGCNIGIRTALETGADMVLLVNSDAVLAPDTLERLETVLGAEPKAGLAAPLILSRAEPGVVASAGIAYRPETGRMRHEGFGSRTEELCERPARPTDVVSGCVMLVRRSLFEAIGLFDERYFYSFEDIEFCLRARRAGLASVLVPSALAYHEGHQSIGASSASRLYYAARNHLLLAQSVLPMPDVRNLVRATGIVMLNLAHAARVPNVRAIAALRAVLRGTRDHVQGRYGRDPRADA